jgi:cell division protein FtsN
MATRNRRARQDESSTNNCPPGWAWLVVGFLIGVFASFLFYLQKMAPQNLAAEKAEVSSSSSASEQPLPYSGKFEFYYPDIIKNSETRNQPPSTNELAPPLVTNPGRYLLQVGSYREQELAEGLKRHIESFGIEANIAQTNLTEKGRWYRVQIGPFTDLNKLNQTSARLKANGIDAIVRKY